MKTRFAAFIFIAFGLSACMWGKPGKNNPAVTKDTLNYVYKTFIKRSPDCGAKPDSECTILKFKYPDFKAQKALNDTVIHKLVTMFQISENADTNMDALSKTFMSIYMESKKGSESMTYALDSYAKIIRQDSSLIAIETGGYVFTGGAHPSSFTGFINWDTKANKTIALADLFSAGNMDKLSRVAKSIFRKNEKLSDTASLANDYFFKDNKFSLNDNFSVTPIGLRFLYNQYEIKSYAAGKTELIIPYSQIKSLLRPNTVVVQYIK